MNIGIEERRVAIEAIATLAHLKNVMVDLILKPAGIPSDVYKPLLNQKDENTGRSLSKRQIAPLILEMAEQRSDCSDVVRRILEITAHWDKFHYADKEFEARAIVQKAREVLGNVQQAEAREARQRELARQQELVRMEKEREVQFRKTSSLLLMMFDEIATLDDKQRKGYLLQDLISRTFDLHEFHIIQPFVRNSGGEQIDGAFKLEGWHYIVECRWRQKLANIRELDGLLGQVERSGRQTMGLFLSINGWSDNVIPLLKQNPNKSIILMEGYDLRAVLEERVTLQNLLLTKLEKLNLKSEPFFSVVQYLNEQ